jgi:hypothetical protein
MENKSYKTENEVIPTPILEEDTDKDIHGKKLLSGWKKKLSKSKQKYYYFNDEKSTTQWDIPSIIDVIDENWKYGIFIVPLHVGQNMSTFIQNPYPWGELHISCAEFQRMEKEQIQDCIGQINSIGSQKIHSLSIQKNAGRHPGARTNLILNVDHDRDEETEKLLSEFAKIKTEQRATLMYGVPELFELDKQSDALEEMQNVKWEITFVARLDNTDTELKTRRLILFGPILGTREYIRDI